MIYGKKTMAIRLKYTLFYYKYYIKKVNVIMILPNINI